MIFRAYSPNHPIVQSRNHTEAVPTLLFIPDISGFTDFVHRTEVSHSRHIIEELLEVIIDANEMDLEISEIEGDAILFYRTGKSLSALQILAQVEKMYTRFHAHLRKYESQRICQCGACGSTGDLSIKFIIHYGDVARKQVKSYSKLFGKDLIVAHRLMKNTIPESEYVLITHQLLNACSSWVEIKQVAWDTPRQGKEEYDFGAIDYCYISLHALQSHVPEPSVQDYALARATRNVELESVINAPIEMVFDVVSDVHAKHLWMVGVKGSDKISDKVVRNGTQHRCIMNEDGSGPFFTSHDFKISKDLITWTDTDPVAKMSLVITFRRIGSQMTRMKITVLATHTLFSRIMYLLRGRKKQFQFFSASLAKLNDYCQDLLREGKGHASSILLEPAAVSVRA